MAKLLSGMDMSIDNNNKVNNNYKERSTFLSKTSFKSTFIVFNALSCLYYLKMKQNNNLSNNMAVDPIDNSQLLYNSNVEVEDNPVSKIADSSPIKKL